MKKERFGEKEVAPGECGCRVAHRNKTSIHVARPVSPLISPCLRIKVSRSAGRTREQSSAVIRAIMIEIIALFIGVVGTLAAPGMPEAYGMPGTPYAPRDITKDTEAVFSQLPGSENLNEKAMPLSKLLAHQPFPSLAQNSVEKSWVPSELPGTKNLAEKRIPEPVLEKLLQLQEVEQRDP